MSATKPELFIIESLDLQDEKKHRHEGKILARMLRLSGKKGTQYYYIRTERELDKIIDIFADSGYRYLHISCHANELEMGTTLDSISYPCLGKKLHKCLSGKRVFVSACRMANKTLATEVLKNTDCYSMIGPADEPNFADAAAFWVTFYHLMFKHDETRMTHRIVRRQAKSLSNLFEMRINYFRRAKNHAKGYRRVTLTPSPSRKNRHN